MARGLAAVALAWLLAASLAQAQTYDRLGPDAIALGASENYPPPTRVTEAHKRHWVAAFSGRDQLYAHHVIRRATTPSPFERAPAPLAVEYKAENGKWTLKDYLARNPVTSLLIAQGSTIKLEHYQYARSERHRFDSQSMAKTIVAMLIGIAIHEGHIASIEERAERYVPDLGGGAFGAATIRDLLQMSSGVRVIEGYQKPDDHSRLVDETLRRMGPGGASALKRFTEHAAPPGTRFYYSGAETFTLALVLRAATGMPLSRYLETRVWQPMGAEADATWLIDGAAQELGFCCFNAATRDYARFALMLAHDGAWNGRQIVPAAWIRAATMADRPHLRPGHATRLRGYGYQLWILPGERRLFAMIGSFRQLALVDPGSRLVMVQTALPPRESPRAEEPFTLFRTLVARHLR